MRADAERTSQRSDRPQRADAAEGWARQALEAARRRGARAPEAHALCMLADIASHGDPPEERADAQYGQALALAEGLGMRPLAAHCHAGLGRLHARTGRREQAREHLASATSMLREMGMTYWLARAEAALRELE